MNKAVSYPIAKDDKGQWVNIAQAQKAGKYFCPECESLFVARLGEIKQHHFAHYPGYSGVCTGESGYHHLAKHLLAYHFEMNRKIPIWTRCLACGRKYEWCEEVIGVQVEKGEEDYRPDVKLYLNSGKVVNCEVVYKHPLGDKFETYKKNNDYLLFWEIAGGVPEVPTLKQYNWLEEESYSYSYQNHGFRNNLVLFSNPPAPAHKCSPYGVAYIFDKECYHCHKRTRIALLSDWFPKWDKLGGPNVLVGDSILKYHSYVPLRAVPANLWKELNRRFDLKLASDYSRTADFTYLMNHCGKCGATQGDHYIGDDTLDTLNQGKRPEEVTIDFELTAWELNELKRLKPDVYHLLSGK